MDDSASMKGKTSASKILKILGSESNAHGVSKIARARSIPRRVVWIVLVAIASTAATIQIVSLVNAYFSYPVLEVTIKSRKTHAPFPAVTICNMNPISLTNLNQELANNSDLLSWLSFTQSENFGDNASEMDSHQAFYENLPNTAGNIGHHFEQMMLSCRYKNTKCDIQNFVPYFDSKDYFNCFTFNGVKETEAQSEKLKPNKAGVDSGLSLILSIGTEGHHAESYGKYDIKNPSAFSGGIRAQIHQSNSMPTPFYHGFDVPPGFSSSVGLKASIHSRLSNPYGDCTTGSLETMQNFKFTEFSCLQRCKQKMLIDKCGCKSSSLQGIPSFDPNIPFCMEVKNWRNRTESTDLSQGESKVELKKLACKQQVLEAFSNDDSFEDLCGCSAPCQETSYEQSVSMSYWPLEFYQLDFLLELYKDSTKPPELIQEAMDILNSTLEKYSSLGKKGIPGKLDKTEKMELDRASAIIRQNFVRLNVYFQDLRVTEHKVIPAYHVSSLLADIGKTLIIWMGVSVLTVMEVFELVFTFILLLFNSDTYVLGQKKRE